MTSATPFPMQKNLMLAAVVAMTLAGVGCNPSNGQRPNGEMSDAAAANAPQHSAGLVAAIDDTAITAKVKERLASDQRVKDAGITVETNNGVVTLRGTVATADQKKAADELTQNVAQVTGVNDQIAAPSAVDDLSAKAEGMAGKVGDTLADATITTKVKAQFAADDTVKATAITVDTDNGVVTLRGQVASSEARKRAVEITRGVEGVKSVDTDQLKVSQS